VRRDELLVDIETDKVVIEIVAPTNGTLLEIVKGEGEIVLAEEVIGIFEEGAVDGRLADDDGDADADVDAKTEAEVSDGATKNSGPAARKLAAEKGVDLAAVEGSGRAGRITKADVARASTPRFDPAAVDPITEINTGERVERRVPMTRLRASVAERLVAAQQTAAMLTTFNEVDMSPVMALRSKFQDEFQQRHNGTRLGYMSFFVRAVVEALKRFPEVNASIDGTDIIYHGYYDIGVAVNTDRGLVVPIVRDADALGMAQVEDQINVYADKARAGKLAMEDITGGTFTISNGGVFGSLMSTPILNPPQTGILGMHTIQQRPVAVDGEVVIRPMMYLALSYDHRLIDGRQAVQFLVAVKGLLEDPARILLEL
ncbi:MAG: 2-oxoglutarate dehydrogenase complex dihydrolipoyllysine-residue succinyltransferase, partial [Proteobacteria bacterium]|nr:2-oxoglutarate dehydrogenase complex dihydrolipoyllysine-residue succinyltransferase [Pseudomonadota bacterium]